MSSCADWLDYRISKRQDWSSVCVLSVTEWLVSNVATIISVRTNKISTANTTLPPLRIFISRNPWHPFRGTHFEKKLMNITMTAWTWQVSLSFWRNREAKLSVVLTWRQKRPTLPLELPLVLPISTESEEEWQRG